MSDAAGFGCDRADRWGAAVGAVLVLLVAECTTDGLPSPSPSPEDFVTDISPEQREALESFGSVTVVGAPDGFTVPAPITSVSVSDDWQELVADDYVGCALSARVRFMLTEQVPSVSVRDASVAALETLMDQASATGRTEAADLHIPLAQAFLDGEVPNGVNLVSADFDTIADEAEVRVRAAAREQAVPLNEPQSDVFDWALQRTELAFTCQGTELNEDSWARLLPALRTPFVGQLPESPGDWPR